MEAVRTSETSVDNNFTRQYIPEDNSERCYCSVVIVKSNVTLSCHRYAGAKGERRYSSYSLFTSALDGGKWLASRPGRALIPGREPSVPIR
jgi:hypothetical protein